MRTTIEYKGKVPKIHARIANEIGEGNEIVHGSDWIRAYNDESTQNFELAISVSPTQYGYYANTKPLKDGFVNLLGFLKSRYPTLNLEELSLTPSMIPIEHQASGILPTANYKSSHRSEENIFLDAITEVNKHYGK